MGIGKRIKEAREKKGYTQAELSKILNVTPSAITNYETNVSHPKEKILYELLDALDVDANFLFQDEVKSKSISLSYAEEELLKKYNSLDNRGKDTIDTILEKEYNHVMALKKQSETEHAQESNLDYQFIVESDRLYMTQYDYGVSAGIGNYLDEWDVPKTTVQIADSPIARKADYILKVDGDSMMPKFEDGDRVFVKAQETVEMNEIGIFVIDSTCYLKQFKGDRLHSLNPTYDDIALNEFQNIKCVGKVLGKV